MATGTNNCQSVSVTRHCFTAGEAKKCPKQTSPGLPILNLVIYK